MRNFDWREAPQAEFAVIGDPVEHSLSPKMHAAAFAHLKLPYRYSAIRVNGGEVAEALEHLAAKGYKGINVTLPHKAEAYAWAKETDSLSKRIGACNTLSLSDRKALNTDGPGLMDTLKPLGLKVGATVLLLGAGGAARAAAFALADAGFDLRIFNRTPEKAEQMIRVLQIKADLAQVPDPASTQLIINATSAGQQGETPRMLWERAPRDAIAYDLSYAEGPTPFLNEAKSRGLRTMDGLALLVAQGARSLEWWLGIEAPREAMLRAIR